MALNRGAAALAQVTYDNELFRIGQTPTTVQRMLALNRALEAYEGARRLPDKMAIVTRFDRRLNKNRRSSDSIVVAILEPEEQAAQVERIYNAVPIDKREAAGLTYEHVRLTLEALR